ncbi:MAG: CapA family protein [Dethiobacteria bacterium]|jgi:poly-gamma-glutamate capsule biosynthesis protein CapA/YwtB (metallophosphatase superfamily)
MFMNKKTGFIFFIIIAFLLCLIILFYAFPANIITKNRARHNPTSHSEQDYEREEFKEQNNASGSTLDAASQEIIPQDLVLAAVGDIMIHSPQIAGAYLESEDRYDFQENFSYISSYLKKADFVIGNLETTLAGEEYGGYSGYPLFNSPPELAGVLKNSGFDLLITANNHSLDRGSAGIINTINNIGEAGLNFVGTARSLEERKKGYLLTHNGIKAAFFAYTYGTNGLPIPPGEDYLVNLIDEQLISEDIFRAKNAYRADIIVICMHWGNEYQRVPSDRQRDLAKKLIDLGANIIIGSHPHVIQPAEIMETEKGAGLVFYSLGNFISNQRDRYCDTGVIAFIKIQLDPKSNTFHISLLEIEPTWVHKLRQGGRWRYRILPIREVLSTEQAQEIFELSPENYQRMTEALQETEDTLWPSGQNNALDLQIMAEIDCRH